MISFKKLPDYFAYSSRDDFHQNGHLKGAIKKIGSRYIAAEQLI